MCLPAHQTKERKKDEKEFFRKKEHGNLGKKDVTVLKILNKWVGKSAY